MSLTGWCIAIQTLQHTLVALTHRLENANTERQRLAGEATMFRRLFFARAVEAANILWPANAPVTPLQPYVPFAPTNLWGLCGRESPDDEDEGELSTSVIIY